jgi:hypothetical protein
VSEKERRELNLLEASEQDSPADKRIPPLTVVV